jgi:hypothetical protein
MLKRGQGPDPAVPYGRSPSPKARNNSVLGVPRAVKSEIGVAIHGKEETRDHPLGRLNLWIRPPNCCLTFSCVPLVEF